MQGSRVMSPATGDVMVKVVTLPPSCRCFRSSGGYKVHGRRTPGPAGASQEEAGQSWDSQGHASYAMEPVQMQPPALRGKWCGHPATLASHSILIR